MAMRNGGDKRGKAADRRRRRVWLLAMFGNHVEAPCTHCGCPLTLATMEVDRIVPGGSYARHNIQPSCANCNLLRGDSPVTPYPVQRWTEEAA